MKDPRECLDEVQALIDGISVDEGSCLVDELGFSFLFIKEAILRFHPDFKCFKPAIEPPKPCTGCGMLTDECECIPF